LVISTILMVGNLLGAAFTIRRLLLRRSPKPEISAEKTAPLKAPMR